MYVLACDDGNTENGDGCDSKCAIEAGYACKDGSPTSSSACSYNGSLVLSLKKAIKNTFSNSIAFTIDVSPQVTALNLMDINSTITTNLPISSISCNYVKGVLMVEIFYTQSIQNNAATVNMTPPMARNSWAMVPSSTAFVVSPDNNQLAEYYDGPVYQYAGLVFSIIRAVTYLAIAVTLVGFFIGKLIVLEMVTAMQIAMLSLALIQDLHPYMAPIGLFARFINGNNDLYAQSATITKLTHPTTTTMVLGVGYEAEFYYNVNYVLIFAAVFLLIAGILLATRLCKKLEKVTWTKTVGWFILRELILALVIFTAVNYLFSTCLVIIFDQGTPEFAAGVTIAVLGLLPLAFVLAAFLMKPGRYSDTHTWLKQEDKIARVHPMILCSHRLLMGFLLGLSGVSALWGGMMVALPVVQIVYVVYYIVRRPFEKTYINVRGIFNELLLLTAVSIPLYYAKRVDTSASERVPILMLSCITLMLSIAIMGLIVYGALRLWGTPDTEVFPLNSGSERKSADGGVEISDD